MRIPLDACWDPTYRSLLEDSLLIPLRSLPIDLARHQLITRRVHQLWRVHQLLTTRKGHARTYIYIYSNIHKGIGVRDFYRNLYRDIYIYIYTHLFGEI